MRYVIGVQTGVLDMVRIHVGKQRNHLLPSGWHCVGRVLDQRPEAGHQEEDPGGGDPPQLRRRDLEERLSSGHLESPCLSYFWQSYTNLNKVAKRDSFCQLKIRNFQYFSLWQCGLNFWLWTNIWLEQWGPHFFLIVNHFFQEPNFCNLFLPSSSTRNIFSRTWLADHCDWVWTTGACLFCLFFGTNLSCGALFLQLFFLPSSSRNIFSATWFTCNCDWLRNNKRWQRRSKFSSSHRRRQRPHQLRVQGQELHLCWQGEHNLGFEPFSLSPTSWLFLYSGGLEHDLSKGCS